MANMHLVTGYAGREHVTAADQAAFHNLFIGGGEFVLATGNQFAASIVSNNQVRVLDGDIYMQGRFIRLDKDTYIDLAIENGASGYFRNDLIIARYTQNHATAIEEVNLVVIKGEAVESDPVDPAYTTGDILVAGDMLHDMPLYRVVIDGLNLVELVPLFPTYNSNLQKKQERTELLNEETAVVDNDHFPFFDSSANKGKKVLWSKIKEALEDVFAANKHKHTANDITSGTLAVARGGTGASSIDELASLLGAARIQTGSYVGTGTSGSSNKLHVTCDFPIKMLIITSFGSGNTPVIWQTGETGVNYKPANGYTNNSINFSESDTHKTVYWHGTNQYDQLNVSGTIYKTFAFG